MSKISGSSGPRYQALLQLLRTSETLWNSSRMFFAKWDLSPSQFNILNVLLDQPDGFTQVELSRVLIMHRSNVTGLVDRLEARRLIQRKDSPADRRAYRVVLTSAGRKLVEKILPDYYNAAEEIWGDFPLDRTRELIADLSRLATNVEKFSATLGKK
jgi:DNA-binding MarR family transcriptional regulator